MNPDHRSGLRMNPKRLQLFLFIAVVGISLLSLLSGQMDIRPATIFRILASRLVHVQADWPATLESVIMDVRLPRLLAGLLIGAGLSISGASFQGLFRNPFVSPHILGVSAGAGFGEVIQELSGKGMTIIMASHFPDHAFLVAQTAAILTNGRIFQMGTPDEVITEANMKAAYGVDVRIVRAGGDDNRKVLIPALKTA